MESFKHVNGKWDLRVPWTVLFLVVTTVLHGHTFSLGVGIGIVYAVGVYTLDRSGQEEAPSALLGPERSPPPDP